MLKFLRAVPSILLASLLCSCSSAPLAATAKLGEPALRETSGLAVSRLNEQHLWLLNDGNHPATLYALDPNGKPLAQLKIRGQRNRDWEDMASFVWRDQSWIVVADIGDNSAKHKKSTLHFIQEPELPEPSTNPKAKRLKIKPTHSVKFVYPDGPRDAEAIAFDPISESLLILSKRDRPGQLYALSLPELFAEPKRKHTAHALGPLSWDDDVPNLATLLINPKRAVSHGMATGFDISSDGLQAVVLGYQRAVLLRRTASQNWRDADKTNLPPHRLEQAEAIGFSRDNQSVFITSEGKHAPLLQMPLPK